MLRAASSQELFTPDLRTPRKLGTTVLSYRRGHEAEGSAPAVAAQSGKVVQGLSPRLPDPRAHVSWTGHSSSYSGMPQATCEADTAHACGGGGQLPRGLSLHRALLGGQGAWQGAAGTMAGAREGFTEEVIQGSSAGHLPRPPQSRGVASIATACARLSRHTLSLPSVQTRAPCGASTPAGGQAHWAPFFSPNLPFLSLKRQGEPILSS